MEHYLTVNVLMALLTLTFLEIVLGIDNIIFISIVTNKLPRESQGKARTIGLGLALVFRVGLLTSITWLMGFEKPWFEFDVFDQHVEMSGKNLILFGGGLFLLAKSTTEINHKVSGKEHVHTDTKKGAGFSSIIAQIVMLDIIFSFDSILTAVGMTQDLPIMIAAVIVSIIIMMLFSGKISDFINSHPSLQILALAFLILIGLMLVVEGFGLHVPKGYLYFGIFFSLAVELLNMRRRKKNDTAH